MYLQLISFLHIDMIQVVEIPPSRTYLFYIVNIMGADVLAMQRARASATMILKLCWTELATLEAKASAGMILTPKARIFRLQQQNS